MIALIKSNTSIATINVVPFCLPHNNDKQHEPDQDMNNRLQLRGNCQCCGRDQAVMRGRIAKHGYEVKDGYFQGVCSGHQFEPLQVKRDIADQIIAQCRADAVRFDAKAAGLKNGSIKPATVRGNYNVKIRDYDELPFDQGTAYQKDNAVKGAIYKAESMAKSARSFADQLEQLANQVHGQPLREVPAEAGPAPIRVGERRKSQRGVLTANSVEGGRVRWTDERGFRSWTGVQSWRRMELVAA